MSSLPFQKGVAKRPLRSSSLSPVLSRSHSNWGRRRWPRWFHERSDDEWRNFQAQVDRFQKQIKEDPYNTIFGRSNDMLRGVFEDTPSTAKRSRTVDANNELPSEKPMSRRDNHNAFDGKPINLGKASSSDSQWRSSSTPFASGRAPVTATSPKDTGASSPMNPPQSELMYDPISGRMIALPLASTKKPASKKNNDDAVDIPVKPSHVPGDAHATSPSNTENTPNSQLDDALSIFDRNQREPNNKSKDRLSKEHFMETRSTSSHDQLAADEQEQLQRSLADYDTHMRNQPQQAPASPEEWLVQEEHSRSTARKPCTPTQQPHQRNAASSNNECQDQMEPDRSLKSKVRKPNLPPDDIDLMTATDVRARMGIKRNPSKGTGEQREEERSKLEEDFDKVHQEKDSVDAWGYSLKPQGLETSYVREKQAGDAGAHSSMKDKRYETALERRLRGANATQGSSASKTATDPYGYPLTPKGLETSYEHEVTACKNGERKSLEDELQEQVFGKHNTGNITDEHDFSFKPMGLETSYQRELEACKKGERPSLEEELESGKNLDGDSIQASDVNKGKVSQKVEEELEKARQQRLRTISLVDQVREIYEKYYGKIPDNKSHQPLKASTVVTDPANEGRIDESVHNCLADYERINKKAYLNDLIGKVQKASTITTDPVNEGRVDDSIHDCLADYDRKNPNAYSFTKDKLEEELAKLNQPPSATSTVPGTEQTASEQPLTENSKTSKSESGDTKSSAPSTNTSHIYKLLAYDRSKKAITTSHATSTVNSPNEHAIPLSIALSKLSQPAHFLPQVSALSEEGYEPVASTANLLVLRLKGTADPATSSAAATATAPRPNPVDGTTIPLPPTPTMSPTGYVNLEPVFEKPAATSEEATTGGERMRRTEDAYSGGSRRERRDRGHGVATVVQTMVWAAATCYVAGVFGELLK
ncbi:uncharacterized protein K452DRAFT_291099 [Aplosporella prunicola CBS 121167]|uniref:Uncharacterized protein n=1 Tax=Aplosporella prunicola CBS 121167 TaxID=1176127 RepID=A0A6A6B1Y0_9PEZI|nr:uncharacterized protein K452DRAFT_291099 [Aplosporella prunicola CBS 121167]KAF2138060.1 hypothetical protein K452DRAFT_291099 [Aplosporella prunicola CBS 121167]